jgi:polygalacturonase
LQTSRSVWRAAYPAVFLALALTACVAGQHATSPLKATTLNVRQFGAVADGKTLCTEAIQKALDECGHSGGGTVLFPPGTYLSQPLTLRTKTTLFLQKGATLKATDTRSDFENPDRPNRFIPFIGGEDLENVTIAGWGTIDGSGAKWWGPAEEARRKQPGYTLPRPKLIVLTRVKNLRVQDITLQNSPTFHLVPTDCEDVVITNVTILAPQHSANTDAIDPSISRRVLITKCFIDVGDDNVAIKSGHKVEGREFACEDITIEHCMFKHGHGVSIGSETPGGVRNVIVRNCTFENTDNGLRIKSPRGRGGRVENIVYSNITMKAMSPTAITITTYYPKIPVTDQAQPVTDTTPMFRNIRISNVKGSATRAAGIIVGLPESLITNVVLDHVDLTAPEGFTIRNAKGVQLNNVKINQKEGERIIVQNAEVQGVEDVK